MVGTSVTATQERSPQGSTATIRSLFLTALFNALTEEDRRIDPLLREYGFVRGQMANPYERVPLHRYVSLIEQAAERLERPFLGLEMGTRFGLTELGPFQALFTSSGTVRKALQSFALFQSRWQTKTLLEMTVDDDATTYAYRIQDQSIWPRQQDAEFTLAGIVTLIRQLTHSKWAPAEVHFEHSIAGRQEQLTRFFKAPVIGNRPANQIVILNEDLDRQHSNPNLCLDEKLKSILECHLLDLMGPEPPPNESLVAQTEEIIARRLGRSPVDCDSVATELNLSGRSFRRRLMEEGTTFRRLLQDARHAKARIILTAVDFDLSVAAEQLGYSDTATFSRAFKEWTGTSPGRYSKRSHIGEKS